MEYENQQAPLKTVITIKSITPNPNFPGFNVETLEGEKYQFGQTKKDGTPTVAFQQFTKIRPIAGDKFEIYYQEKESKPYLNKGTQKMMTTMNRYITKFIENVEGNPVKPLPQAPQSRMPEDDERLDIILSKLDKIIKILGEPVSDEEMAKEITMTEEEQSEIDSIPF